MGLLPWHVCSVRVPTDLAPIGETSCRNLSCCKIFPCEHAVAAVILADGLEPLTTSSAEICSMLPFGRPHRLCFLLPTSPLLPSCHCCLMICLFGGMSFFEGTHIWVVSIRNQKKLQPVWGIFLVFAPCYAFPVALAVPFA